MYIAHMNTDNLPSMIAPVYSQRPQIYDHCFGPVLRANVKQAQLHLSKSGIQCDHSINPAFSGVVWYAETAGKKTPQSIKAIIGTITIIVVPFQGTKLTYSP